jgi:DNA polymerase-3 subunit delta
MKLAYAQLAQHLKKPLAPIYLISSDELLQAQEAADAIRRAAKLAGYSERVIVNVEGNDWGKTLFADANSLSLFGTQRLVELNLTQTKSNAGAQKILQEIAGALPPQTIFLISTKKLDAKTEKTAWYKALADIGVVVQIWPVTQEQLPAWIMQRAKNSGLTLSLDAAKFLADQVEGNLLAAAQEIEKLCLLQNEANATLSSTLNVTALEEIITDNARFDIFNLVECALSGNVPRCLRILENLAAEDIEPLLVLWALTREIRTLAELAKQVKLGTSLSSLFSKFRIWEKRQAGVRRFLQQNTQRSCWQLLTQSAKIDRIIKGAAKGDVWDELKVLTLKIAKNDIMSLLELR